MDRPRDSLCGRDDRLAPAAVRGTLILNPLPVATISPESSNPERSGPGPNLIFIGPPGAGKGSLASQLCSLNIEHVSSGDFFRAEVGRGTALGARFAKALERGELIPDEPTLGVMRKWYFSRKGSRGFLLDGFPRNLLQARAFDEWMDTRRETLTACVYLELSCEEVIRRISGRRVCPNDGMVYHVTSQPPATQGVCDRCGTHLVQRPDDTEETVLHRWRLYEEHTLPVVSYYGEQGLVLTFDVARPLEDLQADLLSSLMKRN